MRELTYRLGRTRIVVDSMGLRGSGSRIVFLCLCVCVCVVIVVVIVCGGCRQVDVDDIVAVGRGDRREFEFSEKGKHMLRF